jgi:hypothetical protein
MGSLAAGPMMPGPLADSTDSEFRSSILTSCFRHSSGLPGRARWLRCRCDVQSPSQYDGPFLCASGICNKVYILFLDMKVFVQPS